MRFNILSEPPESSQLIDWPLAGQTGAHLPPADLSPDVSVVFNREFQFWNYELGEEAHSSGDQVVVMLAKLLRSRIIYAQPDLQIMLDAARGGVQADLSVPIGPEYADLSLGGYAYMASATTLALSRMCREARFEDSARERYGEYAVMLELHPEHLPKHGVHLKDEPLRDIIGIERPEPGQDTWLEGESVFLRARYPAEPSPPIPEDIARFGEVSMHEYTSVVPRLKPAALRP